MYPNSVDRQTVAFNRLRGGFGKRKKFLEHCHRFNAFSKLAHADRFGKSSFDRILRGKLLFAFGNASTVQLSWPACEAHIWHLKSTNFDQFFDRFARSK